MKKLFALMTLLLGMVQSINAQEPYAVLSEDNKTLTFYYDNNKEINGGMAVGPFTYHQYDEVNSGWYKQCYKIKKVVFDKSFASCKSITSTAYWFYNFSNLTEIVGIEYLNTANVTDMGAMFANCFPDVIDGENIYGSLDLSSFNTSNVKNMSAMFYGCQNLKSLDISNFDTANVTNMSGMFFNCNNLTSLDVSKFNTANVTAMNSMFSDCINLTSLDVSKFNTANVMNMTEMFFGCEKLTSLDVSKFNTAKVKYMSGMFFDCNNLTSLDLSKFNTANVTDMSNMFSWCKNLTSLDLSKFNTANVTDMSYMFMGCDNLQNLDLSNFNTANVTDMRGMFNYCKNLTSLDLSKFNTANVTDMSYMFNKCSSLVTIYCNDTWSCDVSNGMFEECESLVGDIRYSDDYTDVTCARPICGYFTPKGKVFVRPYAVLSADKTTLTFYYDKNKDVNKGMGIGPLGWYYVSTAYENRLNSGWYEHRDKIATVVFDDSFSNCPYIRHTAYWFYGCSKLSTIKGIENLNTANVTDMSEMFHGCSSLTSLDMTFFHTSNVEFTYNMFTGCSSLTSLDMTNFNTSHVTYMRGMFSGCSNLKTLYCNDTWNCDDSSGMFYGCSSLMGAIGYDSSKTNATYANPDTGYFTKKASEILLGDANGDGAINDEDVIIVKSYIMGAKSDKFVFKGADANNDGKVNVADIVEIISKKQ